MAQPDPEPYDSPFPECRITATTEPVGFVRLDVSRRRAALLARRVKDTLDGHSADELLTMRFYMDHRAYSVLSEHISDLLETEAEAIQVVLDENPEISIAVLLSETQIRALDHTTTQALAVSAPGDTHAWEVSVSDTGADVLVKQIILASNGESEPLETLRRRGVA